jgi:hypothetical protein
VFVICTYKCFSSGFFFRIYLLEAPTTTIETPSIMTTETKSTEATIPGDGLLHMKHDRPTDKEALMSAKPTHHRAGYRNISLM